MCLSTHFKVSAKTTLFLIIKPGIKQNSMKERKKRNSKNYPTPLQHPLCSVHKKTATWAVFLLLTSSIGGERGIRTLDTLRYTHFPGVLLRPLGQLSRNFYLYHLLPNHRFSIYHRLSLFS